MTVLIMMLGFGFLGFTTGVAIEDLKTAENVAKVQTDLMIEKNVREELIIKAVQHQEKLCNKTLRKKNREIKKLNRELTKKEKELVKKAEEVATK